MPKTTDRHSAAADFVSAHSERLRTLFTSRNLASWDIATSPDNTATERWATADLAIAAIYGDTAEYETVRALHTALAADPDSDPALSRSLDVLTRSYLSRQGDPEIIADMSHRSSRLRRKFGTFRPLVDGAPVTDGAIADVLETSDDNTLRQTMWEASQAVGEHVASDIIGLIELRNTHARSLGFSDYYTLALHLQEMDPQWLESMLGRLDRETAAPFASAKASLDTTLSDRFGVAGNALQAWHYVDPFFQRPPTTESTEIEDLYAGMDMETIAVRFFDGLATDVRPVMKASDLYPRDAKNQHAFCTHIDRDGDVRILCNLRPSRRWMTTLLHELGHAIYDRYISRKLSWLLRTPSHTLSTEAIALLMGRVASEPEFLSEYAGISPLELAGHSGALRRHQSFSMLTFTRWVLVMTHFERELYANPRRADLNELWWNLREKYQGVRRPEGRRSADWAAKIHFAIAPVYYHNYLLGELLASQLRERLYLESQSNTLVDNLYAGEWLISNFFASGNSLSWQDHIQKTLGETLKPDAFLRDYIRQ